MIEEWRVQLMRVKLAKKAKRIAAFVLDHFAESYFSNVMRALKSCAHQNDTIDFACYLLCSCSMHNGTALLFYHQKNAVFCGSEMQVYGSIFV